MLSSALAEALGVDVDDLICCSTKGTGTQAELIARLQTQGYARRRED